MKLLGAALILCALLLAACSPSAYRVHTSAIVVAAGAHASTYAVVDAARDEALDAVEEAHPDVGPERTAALRAEAARWEPAGHALDAIRSALGTWLSAVELARAADEGEALLAHLLPLARRVVALWEELSAALRAVGVDAPPLPPVVLAVLGGGS